MAESLAITIIDDDPAVLDSLRTIFEFEGFQVRTYSDGHRFLKDAQHVETDCLLLDVHMPRKSGLDILVSLGGHDYPAPILIISGQGDIPTVVNAMKAGAHDFIEKPFDADAVINRVLEAVAQRKEGRLPSAVHAKFAGAELLTTREHEVLDQIAHGASSKEAGRALGISFRTIEVHRARIMEKLGARNAADLARIVFSGGPPERT
jgi:two-component system, LuxR family, response regulator FixJ